jgi:succinyl-CoA synthetase beta subunit
VRLYEHEGKALLARYGIAVPRGQVVRAGDDLPDLGYPLMVKAQVLRGGRGKAGAVLAADDASAAQRQIERLLALELEGEPVAAVLVEERLPVRGELYLALTVDRVARQPIVLFSDRGGVEVEELSSGRVARAPIDPLIGPRPFLARTLVGQLGLAPALAAQLWTVLEPLYRLFAEVGCELAEINPLGLTTAEQLVALDAKLEVDDKAVALDPWLSSLERPGGSAWERRAAAYGMSASELGGAITVVTGGAGITMASGDLVRAAGGSLAAVVDLQNAVQGREDRLREVISTLRDGPGRFTFFNFYTQVADCLLYARVIADTMADRRDAMVVRLKGFRAAEGRVTLRERGFQVVEDLEAGVETAVELERGRGPN